MKDIKTITFKKKIRAMKLKKEWLEILGVTEEEREIVVEFKNKKIIIKKAHGGLKNRKVGYVGKNKTPSISLPLKMVEDLGITEENREVMLYLKEDKKVIEIEKKSTLKKEKIVKITKSIAGSGSITPKISIPLSWLEILGVTEANRKVFVSKNKNEIQVSKNKDGSPTERELKTERELNIKFNKSNSSLALPITWIREGNFLDNNREVLITLEEKEYKILINKL